MRDHLSWKTEVPSNRKFPHGRMAIVGRLVVLSVCMLVLGGMRTLAQPGQDARCAAYNGQAKGLCTAAVAVGCFDGEQSPDCDELTANWMERCRDCEGPAPWEGKCPCAAAGGSAAEVYAEFLRLVGPILIDRTCIDLPVTTIVVAQPNVGDDSRVMVRTRSPAAGVSDCDYVLEDAQGEIVHDERAAGITTVELEACREDIRALMDLLDCP